MTFIAIPPLSETEAAERKAWVFAYQDGSDVALRIAPTNFVNEIALSPDQARRIAYLLVQAADKRDGKVVKQDDSGYEVIDHP